MNMDTTNAKIWCKVTDFSIGFGQELFDGMINLALDGKFAGYL